MLLDIQKLSFSYGDKTILQNLSLTLDQGDIATLIGVSGIGKTTFFNILTGMLPKQKGTIQINKKSYPECQKEIAYLTQQNLLLPWRNVLGNLFLLSELGQNTVKTTKKEVDQILEEMELNGCEHLLPDELSGGMQKRVSLARTLLMHRPLILLDEPFNSLDVTLREQMYQLLRKINQKNKTTLFMVTHDFRDALMLSNRIFLLDEGQITKEWKISEQDRECPTRIGELQEEMRVEIKKASILTGPRKK